MAKLKMARARDKELSWKEIPQHQQGALDEAIREHWQDWLDTEAVEVLPLEESLQLARTVPPERILPSRWALKDANDTKRLPTNQLPLRAKARLVGGGHKEPDSQKGLLKMGAPTAMRTSLLMILTLALQFGWADTVAIGDIKGVFLRGEERRGVEDLYMRQPRGKPLPNLDGRQLLRVRKGVFGLPDAPRLWWQAFSAYLVNDAGFEQTSLDCAFFVRRDATTGNPTAMLISHGDDTLPAHYGSPDSKNMEAALRDRFPLVPGSS